VRPLILIAALAENYVIGNKGKMPWNIPTDLKRFRSLTRDHPVLMGRTTYESIGYPLPHRYVIVLSRDASFLSTLSPQVFGATTLESALYEANRYAKEHTIDSIFIAGGGHLYKQTLSQATRLYLTWIHKAPEGDAFFPQFDESLFQESYREEHSQNEEDDCAFTFVNYERV
jgi:dihydrofolate reductase